MLEYHDVRHVGRASPKRVPSVVSEGMASLRVVIEFSGGAELLFDKVKKHEVQLPKSQTWTVKQLLVWIRENLLKERPELFIQNETVRPGILVLINDADWELMGELNYEIQDGDNIVFISTLHGG